MCLAVLALFAVTGGLTPPARLAAQYPPEPPVIAPTDALSPADERKAFTVPAGFEVQLVASEPDIQKPIQMAFDAKGRLWVTTSHHYPFAAPAGKATDKLFVLSDFDPETGKAKKVQVFADDLNIPIGILPLPDCKSCLVSSAGEIRKYTDTDGAGKATKMEVLFTGFGMRDTHGMYNSFTLMPDGWVYACHGYLNTSKVKGKDGHEVEMNSGNTFRFRPDGSRIEVFTRGQVNPFGIAVDPWFNLYTADCHTKPITQLIPGGVYDSFGKPHDGLGYAPHVTRHSHGSTALCGLAWYDADHFPKEYKGTMFLGNVVTNRINFDKIEWKGSTPVGVEQPDFLVSKDPWFRPTDIKLGPDGALYVADFYNKIIGHYEVDLKHPQRDKDRGRVWRIVWKGKGGDAKPPTMHRTDFTTATDTELHIDLFHPNLTVRFLAGHQLRRRAAEGKQLKLEMARFDSDRLASAVGWMAFIDEAGKEPLTTRDYERTVQGAKDLRLKPEELTGQFVRALGSRANWGKGERTILLDIFRSSESVHQKRAAVEAVIFHPHAEFVAPLVGLLKTCPADDTHLRHAARIALRNCLRDDDKAWPTDAKAADPVFIDMALAIPSQKAAAYLLAQITAGEIPEEKDPAVAEHVARYGDKVMRERLVSEISRMSGLNSYYDSLLGTFRGLSASGVRLSSDSAALVLRQLQAHISLYVDMEGPLQPEQTARLLGLTRALIALPKAVGPETKVELKPDTVKVLDHFVRDTRTSLDLRAAATDVLLQLASADGLKAGHSVLADAKTPPNVRDRILLVFAASSNKDARLDARDALKDAPYRTAVAVGAALAGTRAGADDLLDAVKQGKAPARLLQEKIILERLKAANVPDLDKQVAALTKGLPPLDQKIAELIKKRATAFASAKPDKELGAKLFTKHCAACHKIGDQGGKIAPNLDGIGTRGLERLLEDTLDPNRNVDQAFRARVITTKDERTITGLMLRVEGEVLVIADDQGKEIRIPTQDIATNRETMLSPMPANFGEVIPEADFHHLMAYLLDQKAKEPPKK
jgi:putative heme-binding domain-containing protein